MKNWKQLLCLSSWIVGNISESIFYAIDEKEILTHLLKILISEKIVLCDI